MVEISSNPIRSVPQTTQSLPFKRSAIVSSFPSHSGHGQVAKNLSQLGLLESFLMFKIRPNDLEDGFSKVVKPRFNFAGSAVFTSLYFESLWSREIRRYSWAHLCSPHFFHLVRHNPNMTGIVHDLGYLGQRRLSRSPIGYRYLFAKEMAFASSLRGIVAVSSVTSERIREVAPDVRPAVIHNWTGDEFMFREAAEARVKLGLPLDRTLILSVGLDIPRKNIDIFPRLAKRLGRQFTVVRIGSTDRIARKFPAGGLISFPSVPAQSYPLFYNAADMLLLPSLDEGFGVPLIEAINSGTPIVASDIPVFREVTMGAAQLVSIDDLDGWITACQTTARIEPEQRRSGKLYAQIGNHYRSPRARLQYLEFFRQAGLS